MHVSQQIRQRNLQICRRTRKEQRECLRVCGHSFFGSFDKKDMLE